MLLDHSAPVPGGLSVADRATVAGFLQAKADWSWQNHDKFKAGDQRSPVPLFLTPVGAAAYYAVAKGNPYTGDPLWGVVDFYTHPGRLAWALEQGPEAIRRLFIDCDDVAAFYLFAVQQMPGYEAQLVTLIDERIVGSHVVCLWRGGGAQGILDTNGYRVLSNLTEATICATMTDLYAGRGYHYVGACDTPYPWTQEFAADA